jgi:hypothetical protein
MIRLSIYKPTGWVGTGWDYYTDEWYCTDEWKNMVNELKSMYPDWAAREDFWHLIDQELQKYHGRLDKLDSSVSEIIFDDEAGKNWFILRWS